MTYPYGTKGAPAVGGGLPGLPRRQAEEKKQPIPRGEMIYAIPGIYEFTVPENVFSICALAIGGGGGASATSSYIKSGAGAALAYVNNIPVTPGEVLLVEVGAAGVGPGSAATGGQSTVSRGEQILVGAEGGQYVSGSSVHTRGAIIVGSGGRGGNGAVCTVSGSTAGAATGGAGPGYTASGANGVQLVGTGSLSGNDGNNSGRGPGSAGVTGGQPFGSGGVGLFGRGEAGLGGTGTSPGGGGGSGGADGMRDGAGLFGAGASVRKRATTSDPYEYGAASGGAVRILWGDGRAFPSTDVGPSY